MTLVVEDGSIVAGAESYASVAQADAYHEAHDRPSAWLGAKAEGRLDLPVNPADTETVIVDGKTYTFQATLTDSDGNVLIGATAAATRANLLAAMTLDTGAGTLYASSTTAPVNIVATEVAGVSLFVEAAEYGVYGNAIASTDTLAHASNGWKAALLSGGIDPPSTLRKERALRKGTEWLDIEYGRRWKGDRKDTQQVLDHPRVLVYDADSILQDDDTLLPGLLEATSVAALRDLELESSGGLIPDVATPGDLKQVALALGPLKSSKTYSGSGQSPIRWFRKIDGLLARWIHPTGYVAGGLR